MLALLSPRLWIAAALVGALAFSHFTIYRKGKSDVRAEWTAAVAAANEESRRLERARQSRADQAAQSAAARSADDRDRAASADRAIARMRDTLDATERNAARSIGACTATVAAYRAVHGTCVAEYRSLGQEAAGHASDSLMYQDGWPK